MPIFARLRSLVCCGCVTVQNFVDRRRSVRQVNGGRMPRFGEPGARPQDFAPAPPAAEPWWYPATYWRYRIIGPGAPGHRGGCCPTSRKTSRAIVAAAGGTLKAPPRCCPLGFAFLER